MHHSRSPTGPHLILSIDAAPHAVDSSAFSSEWSHTTDLILCFPPDAVSGPDEEARLWRDGRVRTFKATLLLWHYLLEWPRHADTPQAHPLLASHVGGWRGLLRECRRHCDKGTRAHTHTHTQRKNPEHTTNCSRLSLCLSTTTSSASSATCRWHRRARRTPCRRKSRRPHRGPAATSSSTSTTSTITLLSWTCSSRTKRSDCCWINRPQETPGKHCTVIVVLERAAGLVRLSENTNRWPSSV